MLKDFSWVQSSLSKLKKVLGRRWVALPCTVFVLIFVATFITVKVSGDSSFKGNLTSTLVNDITALNPIYVGKVIEPTSEAEIKKALLDSSGPVSIGGGRFSQGGQTAYENSLHFDMRTYDKVLSLDKENKEITVQSGITWRKIQKHIDPHDLSIKIMQTYSNFTVGGSMSVNVHGRYIGLGPLVMSVKRFSLILYNGKVVEASPSENREIFYGAIGGYGGLGVISEVTLSLDDNQKVIRKSVRMPITEYKDYFFEKIRDDKKVVFHNADIYPPEYEEVMETSYFDTDKPVTIEDRLIPEDANYWWQPYIVDIVAGSSFGKWLRRYVVDPWVLSGERVIWRNWEASYDVRELEPANRNKYTYVLREYFIPVEKFDEFYPKMKEIFRKHKVNIINVSIRHAHKDPGTLLAWAKSEVFAFVVYYRQGIKKEDWDKAGEWSREMVSATVDLGGAHYLPYQPHATPEQFLKAYPRAPEFFALKNRLDPENRFINKLWEKYYPKNKNSMKSKAKDVANYFRGEEQTFLTLPEWYLVYNPIEYAEYLEVGKNPSNFPFFASINEYWSLYDRVVALTKNIYPPNDEYMTMLNVIGVSTTVEFIIKSSYENTIGRLTRWTAGGKDTEEDKIIAQAHRAYCDFLDHSPWYEFPFFSWVKKVWSDASFFGSGFIRKIERKLFFSGEFLFKSLYGALIGWGAESAYGEGADLIYAKITLDDPELLSDLKSVEVVHQDGNRLLVGIPRWGGFTKTVPEIIKLGAHFEDIAGNDEIVVSLLVDKQVDFDESYGQKLFVSKVVSNEEKKRWVLLVKVNELNDKIKTYLQVFGGLEHIYDY